MNGERDEFRLEVPYELEAGVYANTALLGYTASEITLDFIVVRARDPNAEGVAPARLVARVDIPPVFAFDLLTAINGILTSYENEWGEIVRPTRRWKEDEPGAETHS